MCVCVYVYRHVRLFRIIVCVLMKATGFLGLPKARLLLINPSNSNVNSVKNV